MQKLNYISILRSISIICVVFFHVYGFMMADHFPATKAEYTDIYFWINNCVIIQIAMPLFTFVAGFLFQYLYAEKNKYRQFLPFLKNKFQRLWIPYLVFGVIMMATTGNFHPLRLLEGGYWHLWYLPRLFWCFLLAWCFNKGITNKWIRLILLPIFLFSPLIEWYFPVFLGIRGIHRWFGWFYLGMIIAEYKLPVANAIRNNFLLFPLAIIYLVVTIFYPVEYGLVTWYSILSGTSIIIILWFIFSTLTETGIKILHPLVWMSKYSFGIYIFHNWVGLYLVGHFSQSLFHLPELTHHFFLFPLCLTIVDFSISLFLSWLLLKTRVGRWMLG